ncbi:hypothetical protein ACSSWA_03070 [Melioribacter sp. Ez-97]|uniref:hypothetical protein n=1 Tax=Melioribacter sp. Ez-97 TaxID=3423434 RepID=UPI003ED95C33
MERIYKRRKFFEIIGVLSLAGFIAGLLPKRFLKFKSNNKIKVSIHKDAVKRVK